MDLLCVFTSLVTAAVASGLPWKIDVTEMECKSKKIKSELKAVILSDLHNDSFGKEMSALANRIIDLNPDFILMPGDIFEENHHQDRAFQLLQQLQKFPLFYATGNHEERRNDLAYQLLKLKELNVQIPEQNSMVFEKNGTKIELLSLPCFKYERDYSADEINTNFKHDMFRILLSHRPHWINLYEGVHCDLVVSGHAHGGQWCIPGTRIGAIAPQQGILPKYISGLHVLKDKYLLVSRGLVRHYHGIPRLFNHPEIVVLNLKPESLDEDRKEENMVEIIFEKENKRSAAYDGKTFVGECTFMEYEGNKWILNHTFVDDAYGGRGIAGKLVEELLLQARLAGVKVEALCSYVIKYLEKHPEYSDLLK